MDGGRTGSRRHPLGRWPRQGLSRRQNQAAAQIRLPPAAVPAGHHRLLGERQVRPPLFRHRQGRRLRTPRRPARRPRAAAPARSAQPTHSLTTARRPVPAPFHAGFRPRRLQPRVFQRDVWERTASPASPTAPRPRSVPWCAARPSTAPPPGGCCRICL